MSATYLGSVRPQGVSSALKATGKNAIAAAPGRNVTAPHKTVTIVANPLRKHCFTHQRIYSVNTPGETRNDPH